MHELLNQARKHWLEVAVMTLTLVFTSGFILLTEMRFPNDDQFILFRYIDNLAAGKGFVYNEGEHVLGATTPLYTLLGAGLRWVVPWLSTPNLLALLNIALLTAGAYFFVAILRRFASNKLVFIAGIVYALNMSRLIPEGMESPLFILTSLWFCHLLFERRYFWSATLLALAVLTRPDAGLLAALGFVFWLRFAGWRTALKSAALAVAIALPWLIFAITYFGTFVPQSLQAKLHEGYVEQSPLQALKVQLSHVSRIYWGRIVDPDNVPVQTAVNLLPVLALVAAGAWGQKDQRFLLVPAVPLVYFTAFSVSNPVLFPWYFSQVEPFWLLASFGGIAAAMDRLPRWWWVAPLIGLIFIAGPAIWWMRTATSDNPGTKTSLMIFGHWLHEHVQPGERVGISNIGMVGYYSGSYIHDFVGLVTPSSVRYYPITDPCRPANAYIIPPELIMNERPEWIVAGNGEMVPCFLESDWFKKHYVSQFNINNGVHAYRLQ